jgi:hypothetical protein
MVDEVTIKDGGEQTIKCGDCNRPLMHYRIYAPHAEITHKIKCTCPFCSGSSFLAVVTGMMYAGPIGSDEEYKSTFVKEITESDGVYTFAMGASNK